jgi:acyl-CoA thioesterase
MDVRMTRDAAKDRRADQELLELDVSEDGRRGTVRISDIHLASFGRMYGGAGASLASAVIEAAARRRLVWVTTQFIGACGQGDRLDLDADVLAAGRGTSQVQVRACCGGKLIFQALGAAADATSVIPDGTVHRLPEVPRPEDCALLPVPPAGASGPGFFGLAERRHADRKPGEDPARSGSWWIRLPGYSLARPALLGLAGDCVPPLVMRAIGEPGAGTSLDNTIRVGAPSDCEWVLIDGAADQAAGGFGHGQVRLWAPDGTLVGTASQTCALWRSLG